MHRILYLFFYLLLTLTGHAQQDFLLLKKKHKTLQAFYNGNAVNFRTAGGEWVDAYITLIANDSLSLRPFELIRYIDAWGMPAVDTMWRSKRKIAVKDMRAFPRHSQSVNYIKDGTILQVGAGGYILLNIINTLSSGDALFENNNGSRLGIAALVFAIGTLMHTSRSPVIETGKKYRLQYIKLSGALPAKDSLAATRPR